MPSKKRNRPQRQPIGHGRGGKTSGTTPAPRATPPKHLTFTKVELRIWEINCIKTTKELDKDEIILSAVQTEGRLSGEKGKFRVQGRARAGKTLAAQKFRKGDRAAFKPPELIAQFPLGEEGDKWPRSFFAVLVMIEKDEGAIGVCLNRVISVVDKELVKTITEKAAEEASTAIASTLATVGVGAAIGGLVVPLVGPLIGSAAGKAVSAALDEIKKAKADDVFPRQDIGHQMHKYPTKAGEIIRKTANFKAFKGHYRVVYSWVVA